AQEWLRNNECCDASNSGRRRANQGRDRCWWKTLSSKGATVSAGVPRHTRPRRLSNRFQPTSSNRGQAGRYNWRYLTLGFTKPQRLECKLSAAGPGAIVFRIEDRGG